MSRQKWSRSGCCSRATSWFTVVRIAESIVTSSKAWYYKIVYLSVLKCPKRPLEVLLTCFPSPAHLCRAQTYLKPIFHKVSMQWEGCGLWHLVCWCNLIWNVPPWTRRPCDRITQHNVCVCVVLSTCKLRTDIESGLWERKFVSYMLLLIGPSCFLSDMLWVHDFEFFIISLHIPKIRTLFFI